MSTGRAAHALHLTALIAVAPLAMTMSCMSPPSKSPVKEVPVQSGGTVAQAYALEEPETGDPEALTAEPPIQGSSLESTPDVLIGALPNGDPVYLSQLRQKVVLVNFLSTGCDLCLQRLREISQASMDYQPHGLVVANVITGAAPQAERSWLEAQGSTHLAGLQLSDPDGSVAAGLGVAAGRPATLLFDAGGREVTRYGGGSAMDRIRQDLGLLLKQ